MKKQYGIEINMICYKAPKVTKGVISNKSVTEVDLNNFMNDFLDLTESKGMCCGGGMNRVDINKDHNGTMKKPADIKKAMKQCTQAITKGDHKLCPLWPNDPSLYCHGCTARYAWKWALGEK